MIDLHAGQSLLILVAVSCLVISVAAFFGKLHDKDESCD